MATVSNPRENRTIEEMIKIFRRECDNEGILSELKKRKYFMKNSRIAHENRKKLEHKKKISAKNKSKY
jgi:ribosomal protein S21